jgi:carboxyl-terminal processing protease
MDRGTEILAIGTGTADLKAVDVDHRGRRRRRNLRRPWAQYGRHGQVAAGARYDGTVRDATVTKAQFTVSAVSSRYGARIIDDGGKKVGYLNLRTFIDTADPQLRSAFAQFKAQGVSEVIVDLRYNAGGQIAIAALMADLLLGQRSPAEVMQYRVHRRPRRTWMSPGSSHRSRSRSRR